MEVIPVNASPRGPVDRERRRRHALAVYLLLVAICLVPLLCLSCGIDLNRKSHPASGLLFLAAPAMPAVAAYVVAAAVLGKPVPETRTGFRELLMVATIYLFLALWPLPTYWANPTLFDDPVFRMRVWIYGVCQGVLVLLSVAYFLLRAAVGT